MKWVKKFFVCKFLETFFIISLYKNAEFSQIREKLCNRKKNLTSTFKIGGFGDKRMLYKYFWNFTHNLFKKRKISNLAVLWRKKKSIGKNSNLIFKNRGYFRKKKKSQVRSTFFETRSEAKCSEKPWANECGRCVHLTTMPLPWKPRASVVHIGIYIFYIFFLRFRKKS